LDRHRCTAALARQQNDEVERCRRGAGIERATARLLGEHQRKILRARRQRSHDPPGLRVAADLNLVMRGNLVPFPSAEIMQQPAAPSQQRRLGANRCAMAGKAIWRDLRHREIGMPADHAVTSDVGEAEAKTATNRLSSGRSMGVAAADPVFIVSRTGQPLAPTATIRSGNAPSLESAVR